MNYNKAIIGGRLARDPELKFTPKGTAIARLSIATSRRWKDDSGQMKEESCFIDVDAWGKQAETIAQYFKKGSKILVDGRLKLDQWDDKKTGEKRSKIGVTLESFSFVDSASQSERKTEPKPPKNEQPDDSDPPF